MTTIRATHPRLAGRGFLHDLGDHAALGFVGPNWFASVMGTGIVANAAVTLPVGASALRGVAQVVWVLAALLLAVVTTATAAHWVRHRDTARGHLHDPVLSHFYGAPAMALMVVGSGALLVGVPLVGPSGELLLAAALWVPGTLLGLWTAVAVPYQAFTSHTVAEDGASGAWLMPVVPPMVSAATGPLFLPYLPPGQWQQTLLLACLAMFGLTLAASFVVITLIWSRLMHHKLGAAAAVPTLWIVLGPFGQSITAAHQVGQAAPAQLPAPFGTGVQVLGVAYGVPAWGFAMLWLGLAVAVTLRVARDRLPFSLTWWSFTFPVGTLVTGTSALAATTGNHALAVLAATLYVGLVAAWVVVACRTLRGAWSGRLLQTPPHR